MRDRPGLGLAFAAAFAAIVAAVWMQQMQVARWRLDETAPSPPDERVGSPTDGAAAESGDAGPERAPVELEAERADAFGVTFEPVRREPVTTDLRAVVTIAPDESALAHVHTRVPGWIERLHVRTTGEEVAAGEPLASIFSRELLTAQSEYVVVLRSMPGDALRSIRTAARSRLVVLGMEPRDIASIERRGEPMREVTVYAPRAGTVLHRGVTVGQAVDPSTELFTIASLDQVWAIAEVPERQAAWISGGTTATIDVPAAGRESIEARVAFVYPTLTERTRTIRVRFVLPNPDGVLRPGTYGTATFHLGERDALTVPRDAVVDTGRRQHVFVRGAEGRLEPREIRVGQGVGDRVEILEGLEEGAVVVASGVFLIDSESRLRATGGGAMPGMAGMDMDEMGEMDMGEQRQADDRGEPADTQRAPEEPGEAMPMGAHGGMPMGEGEHGR